MEFKGKIVRGKVIVVGDGSCGKTCMLNILINGHFPEDYVPTVVDTFNYEVKLSEEITVNMSVWDNAGQEEYDIVRPMSYKDTDIAVICYSIEERSQLENVCNRWIPELNNSGENMVYFLVALKSDLRDIPDNKNIDFIKPEEGKVVADQIGALGFFECSAKKNQNIKEIYVAVAKAMFDKKTNESKKTEKNSKRFCGLC
ncbi:Small GTP-binding protein domain [Trinorchestia longiramus]|nr:Small GTP-binding protein domain [Trinorchestia longiramus]